MSQDTFSARELQRLTGLDRRTIAERLATISEDPSLEELVAAFVGTKAPETGPGLFSTSELAKLSGLNRATVAERLESVNAHQGAKGAKLYTLADALPALIAGRDVQLDQTKLRKLTAETEHRELDLARARAEVVVFAEVKGTLQDIFKALHRRLALQLWRTHSRDLKKCKTAGALAKAGEQLSQAVFDELTNNHQAFFGSD